MSGDGPVRQRFRALRGVLLRTGLVLGTLVAARAEAQVRPDSVKRDTTVVRDTAAIRDTIPKPIVPGSPADSVMQARITARMDSIAKFRTGDTVRAPIAHFESPTGIEMDERLRFDRAQILSSGALNLADLLDRVPGVTSFRSGWLAGIHAAAYNGDFSRIRIFLDGVEMDAVEARNGGVLDLDDVPLWTLDELVIERAAGEVRVWLRSWSYTKTIPFTRIDIFTGDRNTNGFRGLFARRFDNGFILQVGAQQAATQTGRVSAFTTTGTARDGGDGSQQVINSRIGWSRNRLTVDLYGTVSTRDRDPQAARENFADLPAFKGARRDGYFRVAYGDTLHGFWSQAIVAAVATRLDGIADNTPPPVVSDSDSVVVVRSDSLRARSQQVLAVGYRGRGWQYSVLDRVRAVNGETFHAPAVRASIGGSRLSGGAYAERRGIDSTTRIDLHGRMEPLRWMILTLSQSLRRPTSATERPNTATTRAEAGVRLRSLLFSGGVLREDTVSFVSPVLLGADSTLLGAGAATGFIGGVRGRLYKDLRIEVQGIRWSTAQFNRPRTAVRTELALVTEWRGRFPKGQFGFNARLVYETRDAVSLFYGTRADETPDIRTSVPSNVLSGIMEIRIQRATLFYLYRNLTGGDYEQIPGLTMPPAVQMYGVRWEFFN